LDGPVRPADRVLLVTGPAALTWPARILTIRCIRCATTPSYVTTRSVLPAEPVNPTITLSNASRASCTS